MKTLYIWNFVFVNEILSKLLDFLECMNNFYVVSSHIQEHLEIPLNTTQMTEKELHFHYFNMYDTDKNRMLDGIEISKQIVDQLGHHGGKGRVGV